MNSRIILAKNINIDRDYKNVLSYSSNQILELLLSNNHLVNQSNNYSFINGYNDNSVSVGFTYQECLNSNYIAFQNPNYSNKWFFAFITDLKYISDRSCQINFQVDAWSTWFDNWIRKPCFTIREHVSNDTIGLHTVPENLETGPYKVITQEHNLELINTVNVIGSTIAPSDLATFLGGIYNGIFSGIRYYTYSVNDMITNLQNMKDKNQDIQCLFIAPKNLCSNSGGAIHNSNQVVQIQDKINAIYSNGNYTPKNKKLLTYPFVAINLFNGQGTVATYRQEFFQKDANGRCRFQIDEALTPGCSIRCYPIYYKNSINAYDEGISLGKYPQLNWATDVYTNWLTQNAVNTTANVSMGAVNLIGGLARAKSGDVSGLSQAFAGGISVADSVQQIYQHQTAPAQVQGNINCGDVVTANLSNTFYYQRISITEEYAKIIDDFFSRYGYKVNRMKVPEMISRKLFNYIQIGSSEEIGDGNVPVPFMEKINQACRNGVTIWHDHENMFNFNNDNSIK